MQFTKLLKQTEKIARKSLPYIFQTHTSQLERPLAAASAKLCVSPSDTRSVTRDSATD